MDIWTIFIIAFGLAMDAVAVSITNGISMQHSRMNNALKMGISFGLFQAFMPIIGWMLGLSAKGFISGVDHWVAFGLISLIGCKMIYESLKINKEKKEILYLNLWILLILSIATSIDALAIGISFALLKISIVAPIIIIGCVTAVLSFIGFFVGNKIGSFVGKRIETIGGLTLIGIGIKILIEHL